MRRRMDQNQNLNESGGIMQKSKTRTIQALLLAFILATFALWMGPAVAAEKKMVKDPSTGKMVTAPEYGGTISFVFKTEPRVPTSTSVVGGMRLRRWRFREAGHRRLGNAQGRNPLLRLPFFHHPT